MNILQPSFSDDPRSSILYPLIFCILFALPYLSHPLDVPPLRGRVNDLAGLLPPARARALEERLERFERETGHQIAVLTIPSLEGEDLEGFSIRVAESWKIGQKGFDNGAILLVSRNDRRLRIEVGYGLEGILPDAIASRIIREVIVPRFRANDYAGGIEAGLEAIMKVTQGEPLPTVVRRQPELRDQGSLLDLFFLTLFLGGALLLVFLTHQNVRRRPSIWSGASRHPYNYWGGGFGGGGFGGSGFGGGGGFSGGGGGFGGGGASGRW